MNWHTFLLSAAVALLFSEASVSSLTTVRSIGDLRNISFGHYFPRHGLQLLHWFVSFADVDVDRIVKPLFDPTRGDRGFAFYQNENRRLPALTDRDVQAYYSVGDLRTSTSWGLPQYVTQNNYNSLKSGDRNRDRIVVRVLKAEGLDQLWIDEVYLTQLHPLNDNNANTFDPKHTFAVDFELLKEIKALQTRNNDTLAGLGLFLQLAGYELCSSPELHTCSPRLVGFQRLQMVEIQNEDECSTVRLDIRSASSGCSVMSWSAVPKGILDHYVSLALFMGDDSQTKLAEAPVGNSTSGAFVAAVALNPGLQLRLLKRHSSSSSMDNEIWRGSEFNDANGVIPADVDGHASLQLYTKSGYACARLFIKKTPTTWETRFYYSWVGFHSSNGESNNQYETWKWVVQFQKETFSQEIPEYNVFVYESSVVVSPGVQARFFLSKYNEVVRTVAWDSPGWCFSIHD